MTFYFLRCWGLKLQHINFRGTQCSARSTCIAPEGVGILGETCAVATAVIQGGQGLQPGVGGDPERVGGDADS